MKKNMMGTKEVKEMVEMNGGIRIGSITLRETKNGDYIIIGCCKELVRTNKLNTALDWLVEVGYLDETRFRLTADQKAILRSNIWNYLGWALLGTLVTSTSLMLVLAWLFVG